MKRLIILILMCILAYGNPADYITMVVNGVDQGDYTTPMAYNVDWLPTGTHHIVLIPHLNSDHIPTQVDMTLTKKENKKFVFGQIIPQPGDEQYFDLDLLRVKEEK